MTLNQKSTQIENCCNEILQHTKTDNKNFDSYYYKKPDEKLIAKIAAKHALRKEFITSILTENN